jgi:2,4-dienoyl-CoA reductase (NADPH2)
VLVAPPLRQKKAVAVVGAGPAGLAGRHHGRRARPPRYAVRRRGRHRRQFNLARRIPGKEEFAETLRYFRTRSTSWASSSRCRGARRRKTCAGSIT